MLQATFCAASESVHGYADKRTIVVPLLDSAYHFEEALAHTLPHSCVIESVTGYRDITESCSEELILMGLEKGFLLTEATLAKGLRRLSKRRRYKQVSLIISPHGAGCGVTVMLESAQFIERITLSGTLLGRDKYRQLYTLRQGTPFEIAAHEAALAEITKTLVADGYCNARVHADLVPHETRTALSVHIAIDHGVQFRIREVQVMIEGADRTLERQEEVPLRRLIRKELRRGLRGEVYSREVLNKITLQIRRKLTEQGYSTHTIRLDEQFERVKGAVSLQFTIALGKKTLYQFYGNTFFPASRLLDQIMLFGASTPLVPVSFLADEIASLYKKHGFPKVHISVDEDDEQVFFFITEGPRAHVRTVCLEGATFFSQEELIKRHFEQIRQASYCDDEMIKSALESLARWYLEQGFWDVEIVHYEVPIDGEGCGTLQVTLREGVRRMLKGVVVDPTFPCMVLLPRTQLVAPIPFDSAFLQEDRRLLITALRKDGRLYAVPMYQLEEDKEGIVVRWRSGGIPDQIRFGKTILHTTRVKPAVIMREVESKEGLVWDATKLDRTVARLRGLGIFDAVSLVPDDITVPEHTKDLLLQCSIDAPYEMRLRAGIQGVNRNIVKWDGGLSYKAGFSFLAKNPTGSGDLLRTDLDYSRYMHEAMFLYKVPWLFQVPLRSEFKVFSSRYDQPVFIGSPEVLYRTFNQGFLMGVNNTYGALTGGIQGGVAWQGLQASPCGDCSVPSCGRQASVARTLIIDPAFLNKRFPYFFIEPTIMFDVRDDKVNTNYGSLTLFALRASVPYGINNAGFIKLILEQSCFTPLFGQTVFGVRMRMGTMLHAPFDRILPAERFYLGGPHSLRSYNADYAPPLNAFVNCCGGRCLVPIGGKSMVNINCEARFPIYGPLGGVTFLDIGALSLGPLSTVAQPHVLMGALGFGLRFNTVLGPLRFDIGWKLKRDYTVTGELVCDKGYAWFLTLGQAF